ncbi:MAG: glycogen synthase [Bacteroidia bacterium]|nr:MAG: glycogen synthase [Bacteroidia bacterium]
MSILNRRKMRVLYVCQEIEPFVDDHHMAPVTRQLPKSIQDRGREIRTFMPKFGSINERRHQLHEVIRLSGANIVVDDVDYQLVVKVASMPGVRMQVYFIDNEVFFQDRGTYYDFDTHKTYKDNDLKMVFYAKGILETVKNLQWHPDIVHVIGWYSALLPVYIRKYFADEPYFSEAKIVTSVYSHNEEDIKINANSLVKKLEFDGLTKKDVKPIVDMANVTNLYKLAIDYSDAIVYGDENINDTLKKYIQKTDKPTIHHSHQPNMFDVYDQLYNEINAIVDADAGFFGV